MAIHQHKRENLFAEATAYRCRAILRPSGLNFRGQTVSELFIGCRSSGGWSFYLDESPVLQFNSLRQLRRLYIDEASLIAESGRLISLDRTARGGKVRRLRTPLPEAHQTALVAELTNLVQGIREVLEVRSEPNWLVAQFPATDSNSYGEPSVVYDCARWLRQLPETLEVASLPNATA